MGAFVHHFDPIAFHIFGWPIRWYGLAYILGAFGGWQWTVYLARKGYIQWTKQELENLLTWVVLGVVIGGRLGYGFFYEPLRFIQAPWEILLVWRGGMAFHGGLLGVVCGAFFYGRRYKRPLLEILDVCALSMPIGLCLGRIANFINGEHMGTITGKPWGVVFPQLDFWPRHPTQLYEAFFEGVVLFGILTWAVRRTWFQKTPGRLMGLFLIWYGLMRVLIEFVRLPDAMIGVFTVGQVLTIPMVLAGGYFLARRA